MTAYSLSKRITQLGFSLLSADFAMDARQHVVGRLSRTRSSVMWSRASTESMMIECPSRIQDYCKILENLEYSYLMNDGGVFQIAYTLNKARVESHRLLYFPCPFSLDFERARAFEGGLLDFIKENYLENDGGNIVMRSPLRFDYTGNRVAEFHPASHLTINDPCCRIPARAPLQFDTFMKFILENFYLPAWKTAKILAELRFDQEDECLSDHDKSRAYLQWSYE